MNLGELSVKKNRVAFVLMFLVFAGGLVAYHRLGRLEDPEFTIKEALIITPYPGASAEEVAREVTNPIESACQQLGQLKRVESESTRGRSVVSAVIQDRYQRAQIPQVWDELRRKIDDVQSRLPPSVRGKSLVVDDFGDVYGVFLAITGKGFTQPELRRYAEFLRRELILVGDVKKVDLFSEQQEVVFLEISRQRLAQLGINEDQIYSQLQAKNVAADGGRIRVGDEHIAIDPTGSFESAEDMLGLVIGSDSTGRQLFLKDVATLSRTYEDPPHRLLRFDGQPAIGLGISTVQGGNVVTMGNAVRSRLAALKRDQPIGIEIGDINFYRASDRDGPQGGIDHRLHPVPHDHGDVPGDVSIRQFADGAYFSGRPDHRAVHADRQCDCGYGGNSGSDRVRRGQDPRDSRCNLAESVAAVRSNGHRGCGVCCHRAIGG
jgi:multidrug efflux pump subunit AcrB